MKTTFLDFEQPVAELEARIDELRFVQDDSAVDISDEIERLSKKSAQLTKELYGDRAFADDASIVGGLARLNAQPCMLIGHQKGRDTKERAQRNFGMPR